MLDRSFLLKFLLLFAIIALLGNAIVISRDYQDSWVLEGLEIPFLLFVTTYALTFFSEKKVSLMVALAVIGRCIFLLIPNLKYVWFQGKAIDQHQQYALANYVYNEGYVPTQGPFGVLVYSGTPLIHLTFAIFSIVPGIRVVDSIKYLPVFLSPIYPLLTYVMIKKLKFPRRKTALQYALFVSSIPISAEKYVVTGAQFGVLLTFLVLTSLMILVEKNDRHNWFVFIFFISVLAATHSSSSVLLTIFLFTIMLIQRIPYFRLRSHLHVPTTFAIISICGAWLLFPARFTLEQIARVVFVKAPTGATPKSEEIPSRLFQLIQVDMLGAIKSVLVLHGAEVCLLLLTFAGLMILLKIRRQLDDASKFLCLIGGVILGFIPIGFILQVGLYRISHIVSLLFPIFCGIFILYAGKRRVWTRAVILPSIILLATFQVYCCQPLIPSANILSKDLPTDEPIVYVGNVNSVYQRQMITFSRNYVDGLIACDHVTANQIRGLTEFDFSTSHLAYYDPLEKNQSEKKYDYFLIHLPGVSGVFTEQAEMRTRDFILKFIYSSSIIYTNSEAYILAYNFTQQYD